MVIEEALNFAIKKLQDVKYIDPLDESIYLLSRVLKKDVSYIYLHRDKVISKNLEDEYKRIVCMRSKNYPFHYIFNEKDFYGMNLYVDENVLIPRGETEILVEYIIEKFKKEKNINILEIGVGSGAISLALAKNLPQSEILGVDISKEALEVAKYNRSKLKLDNVDFIKSDLYSKLSNKYYNYFDIIVSNPPYLYTEELLSYENNIDYEPKIALDGGRDGLDFYRDITKGSKKYLSDNGMLFYEIGYKQGKHVKEILERYKFRKIKIIKDYQGLDRIVFGNLKE